jgi:RNA-binding protein Luc7-like 2
MDLGECPKIHDLALRADYEKAQQKKDYFYDVEVSLSMTFEGQIET